MKNLKVKINKLDTKIVVFLCALYALTGMHVIFMNENVFPFLLTVRHFIVISTFVALAFYRLIHLRNVFCLEQKWIVLFIILLYIYQGINNINENQYFTFNSFITLYILIAFVSLRDSEKRNTYEMFKKMYVCVLVPGIVLSILRLLHLDLFLGNIYPSVDKDVYHHYVYSFMAVLVDENKTFMRFCGIFNEPGVIGTVSALLIIIEKYHFKDKTNIILFLSGLLSMSTAFFALSLAYFVFVMIVKKKNYKMIFWILIGVGLFFLIDKFLYGKNEIYSFYIHDKIFNLLSSGESNRTSSDFDLDFQIFVNKKKDLWYGYGVGAANKYYSVLSIKKFFMECGIVGIGLFVGMLLAFLFSANINYDVLIFMSCYSISLYQRPYIYNPFIIVILNGGIIKLGNIVNEKGKIWKRMIDAR